MSIGAGFGRLYRGETTVDYACEPKGLIGRITGPLLDRQLRKGFRGFLADLQRAAQQQPTV